MHHCYWCFCFVCQIQTPIVVCNRGLISTGCPPTGGEGGPTGCSLNTQVVDHLTIQQQGYT